MGGHRKSQGFQGVLGCLRGVSGGSQEVFRRYQEVSGAFRCISEGSRGASGGFQKILAGFRASQGVP